MKFSAQKRKPCPSCKCALNFNWESVNAYLFRYKENWFNIEIQRKQRKKSDPLRKYYFGVVLPDFMAHLGYEKHEDELFHRQLKITYYRIEPDQKGIYRNVPSVFGNKSEIPVGEKKDFVDWVVRTAAKDGVYIPDPGE